MKKKTDISSESFILNYSPVDYMDSYSREVSCERRITPEEFSNMSFNNLPCWISNLLRLRNVLVKPFGLDTKRRFSDLVYHKSDDEIIFGMADKHLNFHVSLWCGEYNNGKQELRITTVVKYNNTFGRVYFFAIRFFHCKIISSILKNIDDKCAK